MFQDNQNKSKDASTAMDDSAITIKLKAMLAASNPADAINVSVETSNSIVTLKANSEHTDALNRAKAIAEGIEAVKEVVTQVSNKQ